MRRHIVRAFAVVFKRWIAVGPRLAANCSKSRRTLGSAFSQTIRDALVWWMNRWQRPRTIFDRSTAC